MTKTTNKTTEARASVADFLYSVADESRRTDSFGGKFTRKKTLLQQFGRHRAGPGCVYIKKLQGINIELLGELIQASPRHLQNKYSP